MVMKTLFCLGLVGCAASPSSSDVVGPFTGTPQRFIVDSIVLPATVQDVHADADDLDGDGVTDNGLGSAFDFLALEKGSSTNAADLIASGAIASTVEIQADDLTNDPTVAVTYIGADGDPATLAGGAVIDGSFRSNRSRDTRVPGSARLHLPIFADADPFVIDAYGVEIDLDSDGRGGFDGVIHGAIDPALTVAAAKRGMTQMFTTNPTGHTSLFEQIDSNRDGVASDDELAKDITPLVEPDVDLLDDDGSYAPARHSGHPDSLSFGIRIHISPCPGGVCPTTAVLDRCHDRVRDGDETDVDCGGSCEACAGASTCSIAADCQSQACSAGVCAAASCSDGVVDGFETQVDCGWSCPCAIGQSCSLDADCASHHCPDGTCQP
jgi:hypothetical protein